MKIHLWVPDYASAIGGIQTFSRLITRGIRDLFPDARLTVVSKNDTSYPAHEINVATKFVPLGWWPGALRTSAFSSELFRLGAIERPDLIFTTHVNFSPVAHALQKLFGIPFIALGNGIEVWDIKKASLKAALRAANQLLAISECTRQRMSAQLSIDSALVRLLPCTFEEDKFIAGRRPRFLLKRYGLRPDQPVILTVTRLASAERYKGYDQMVRALPAIRNIFPDVRYVLGGRGPDRPRVEALIAELGVSDNVTLAGYIPEHELREHYNLCDVFAMPSKGEGFGIVFLEAAACGKPVLAGNKDGSVDAVLNGEIGALVDPEDVAQIAETLIAILGRKTEKLKLNSEFPTSNSELHDSRSAIQLSDIMFDPEALRARVIEAYGYERFKQRLSEILEPLLKR